MHSGRGSFPGACLHMQFWPIPTDTSEHQWSGCGPCNQVVWVSPTPPQCSTLDAPKATTLRCPTACCACCLATAAPPGYVGADPHRAYKEAAASSNDFFCGVVPGNVLSGLGKAMNLEGAAGLAVKRLAREGLAWVPTAGNICTVLAFGICVYLNVYMTGRCYCKSPLLRVLKLVPLRVNRSRYTQGHAWTQQVPSSAGHWTGACLSNLWVLQPE